MIFVVDRRDLMLRFQNGCIRVEKDGALLQRIPIKQLEQVVVYGNPIAETAVWRALSAAEVPTVMLSVRGADQTAIIGSGLAVQLPVRRLQHRLANRSRQSLQLAKWFIARKIDSYGLAIDCLVRNFKLQDAERCAFSERRQSSRLNLAKAEDIQSISGVEGQLAHAWFGLLTKCLPAQWHFSGRNRRPPRDPVNALLSLGYTLIMSEIGQSLTGFGLDPSLGFLHQDYPGRQSLALDVTEIFRSAVDCFVLQTLSEGVFSQDSFYYRSEEGCRLSKQARPDFFRAWAGYREDWPRPLPDPGGTQYAPVREQITGQLMQLYEYMKTLEP